MWTKTITTVPDNERSTPYQSHFIWIYNEEEIQVRPNKKHEPKPITITNPTTKRG